MKTIKVNETVIEYNSCSALPCTITSKRFQHLQLSRPGDDSNLVSLNGIEIIKLANEAGHLTVKNLSGEAYDLLAIDTEHFVVYVRIPKPKEVQ